MRLNLSVHALHAQLSIFVTALLGILIGLSAIAASSLISIDKRVQAVDQKWLASTQLLGEWTDRISEFRLAETYRAIAPDKDARDAAESLADEHRHVIDALRSEYVRLHGGEAEDLRAVDQAWREYRWPRPLDKIRHGR